MKPLIATFAVLCFSFLAAEAASVRYSTTEIAAAIREGKIGAEFAERARDSKSLQVQEITGEQIPFQIFAFFDSQGGHTILVEADDRLVVLCGSFGGGVAHSFTTLEEDGKTTLTFRFNMGSGRLLEQRAKYVIGSRKPELVGPIRDATDDKR